MYVCMYYAYYTKHKAPPPPPPRMFIKGMVYTYTYIYICIYIYIYICIYIYIYVYMPRGRICSFRVVASVVRVSAQDGHDGGLGMKPAGRPSRQA